MPLIQEFDLLTILVIKMLVVIQLLVSNYHSILQEEKVIIKVDKVDKMDKVETILNQSEVTQINHNKDFYKIVLNLKVEILQNLKVNNNNNNNKMDKVETPHNLEIHNKVNNKMDKEINKEDHLMVNQEIKNVNLVMVKELNQVGNKMEQMDKMVNKVINKVEIEE